MKKALLWIILLLVIIIGIAWWLPSATDEEPIGEQEAAASATQDSASASVVEQNENAQSAATPQTDTSASASESASALTTPAPRVVSVRYTDAGFEPRETRVSLGDMVMFTNGSSRQMWPASAVHPTHAAYPGSGIEKCGTAEAATIFDACSARAAGDSYSFTFERQGSWKYHNHLQPTHGGSIVVE